LRVFGARGSSEEERALPFLERRCNIFGTIYFNPSPYSSPVGGEEERGDEREDL